MLLNVEVRNREGVRKIVDIVNLSPGETRRVSMLHRENSFVFCFNEEKLGSLFFQYKSDKGFTNLWFEVKPRRLDMHLSQRCSPILDYTRNKWKCVLIFKLIMV